MQKKLNVLKQLIGGVEDAELAEKAVDFALSHAETVDFVPKAVEFYNKEISHGMLQIKKVNLISFRAWLKTYLKEESEARSMQEITGTAAKKRKRVVKHVVELPQLWIDKQEEIYAMLSTKTTGNHVKVKVYFNDFM